MKDEIDLIEFFEDKLSKILNIDPLKLEKAFHNGIIKYYHEQDVEAIHFRKGIEKIESGTMVSLDDKIDVIRGFPKIRRTLMLKPAIERYFKDEIAVEEKMNGYNVRIALFNDRITAFTRGGYICPYTTKKAKEIMDLESFFQKFPQMVICGEMVGDENPYVSHYYPEIDKIGFRIFDLREKLTNKPLPIMVKRKFLKDHGLIPVNLLGIFSMEEAPEKIMTIIKGLGEKDREGVVMKDPHMILDPIKYTSSQAHASELQYAFKFPFDLAKAFFFTRIIREGFQAYENAESDAELRERALRIGESILYPMLDTINCVSDGEMAAEDLVIEVESKEEADAFIRHLRDLGVLATLAEYKDGKAVIRRIHQSTTDKINNYLDGGLY